MVVAVVVVAVEEEVRNMAFVAAVADDKARWDSLLLEVALLPVGCSYKDSVEVRWGLRVEEQRVEEEEEGTSVGSWRLQPATELQCRLVGYPSGLPSAPPKEE
jgi:hypothetical protein